MPQPPHVNPGQQPQVLHTLHGIWSLKLSALMHSPGPFPPIYLIVKPPKSPLVSRTVKVPSTSSLMINYQAEVIRQPVGESFEVTPLSIGRAYDMFFRSFTPSHTISICGPGLECVDRRRDLAGLEDSYVTIQVAKGGIPPLAPRCFPRLELGRSISLMLSTF